MLRFLFLSIVVCLSGCLSARGFNPMQNQSQVQLSENDFTVVTTGLRGEASCAYLFGFIPLGDPAIATRAMDELVKSADTDGKSRGIVNFSFDHTSGWFVIFTVRSAKVRGDVVEFR